MKTSAINLSRTSFVKAAVAMSLFTASITAVYAEDGGLMTQMMSDKYSVHVNVDSQTQQKLHAVKIPVSGQGNGGLMKQMQGSNFAVKTITDPQAQARLNAITLSDTNVAGHH